MFSIPESVKKATLALNEKGFAAHLVGGCTRDMLRGVTPHDFDMTTDATPEEMKMVFEGYRTVETGIRHGTLTVLFDGEPLEITTYRIDGTYSDARHPDSVSFTRNLQEDLKRRDFTVNAMAYSEKDGIIDCYGGQTDLQNRVIRAVGDPQKRFEEDALRILRAMRFASVLDFTIEPGTLSAMNRCKNNLLSVSAERVREELLKMLCGSAVFRVLTECKSVLGVVLPELIPCFNFDQHTPFHRYDVFTHSLLTVTHTQQNPLLRFAALLHDAGKPHCFSLDELEEGHFYGHAERSSELAAEAVSRLKFSKKDAQTVVALVKNHHMPFEATEKCCIKRRASFDDDFLQNLFALEIADALSLSTEEGDNCAGELLSTQRFFAEEAKKRPPLSLATLAVKSQDLLQKGISPGKEMGLLLKKGLEAVAEGKIPNEKSVILSFLFSDR